MTQSAYAPMRLSLRGAISDLGWPWLVFATIVGAPSILALLQMVFVEHRLSDALQWIVDGYNDIVGVVGAMLEPILRPALAWLNETFDWGLVLQPHWKPLFMLATVRLSANARLAVQPPLKPYDIFVSLPLVVLVTLAGVVLSGCIAIDGSWLMQGAIAALPIGFMMLAMSIMGASSEFVHQGGISGRFAASLLDAFFFTLIAWLLGATLTFLPGVEMGAGVLGLGALLLVQALLSVLAGLNTGSVYGTRMGLIMLGGFFTAGVILIADAILRALS
ncbi:MAG: hypothetical protein ACT4OF_02965 [Caulobacteraceae bacterium]